MSTETNRPAQNRPDVRMSAAASVRTDDGIRLKGLANPLRGPYGQLAADPRHCEPSAGSGLGVSPPPRLSGNLTPRRSVVVRLVGLALGRRRADSLFACRPCLV